MSDFNAPPIPQEGDMTPMLLRKVCKILYDFFVTGGGTPGSGGATKTPVVNAMAENSTVTIPAGAKGYSVKFFTGTGTFKGVPTIAGLGIADSGTLAVNVAVTTDAGSTAFVCWNT